MAIDEIDITGASLQQKCTFVDVVRVDNKKIKVSKVDFFTTVACLPY